MSTTSNGAVFAAARPCGADRGRQKGNVLPARLSAAPVSAPERAANLDLFFADPRNYLHRRRYEIRLRSEIALALIGRAEHSEILDIGCGDGSISLPLLNSTNHLTLLDVCGNMLARAQSKIPSPLAKCVTCLHADVMTAPLSARSFDLVLCLGVLAHAEFPLRLICRIASLLRRDGTLILQFTDSRHFLARPMRLYGCLCNAIRPAAYHLNVLSASRMLSRAASSGLKLVATYRYASLPPGAHRVFTQRALYRLIHGLFGTAAHNRNAWLGNEYICKFRLSR